jgi:hypothetical protein
LRPAALTVPVRVAKITTTLDWAYSADYEITNGHGTNFVVEPEGKHSGE